MKPFNLERALAGAPVVTRDGRKVEQLVCFLGIKEERCVYGVIDKCLYAFTMNGSLSGCGKTDCDLFMAPKKRTVWINLYEETAHSSRVGWYYNSEAEANESPNTEPDRRIGHRAWPLDITE